MPGLIKTKSQTVKPGLITVGMNFIIDFSEARILPWAYRPAN